MATSRQTDMQTTPSRRGAILSASDAGQDQRIEAREGRDRIEKAEFAMAQAELVADRGIELGDEDRLAGHGGKHMTSPAPIHWICRNVSSRRGGEGETRDMTGWL